MHIRVYTTYGIKVHSLSQVKITGILLETMPNTSKFKCKGLNIFKTTIPCAMPMCFHVLNSEIRLEVNKWLLSKPDKSEFFIFAHIFPSPAIACLPSYVSCIRLCVTLWTVAHQIPLSMGFSKQKYWSELPCPPPGDLLDPGIKPASLRSSALAGRFLTTRATWESPASHWEVANFFFFF